MLYRGVDLHAKSRAFCVMTRRGKAGGEGQVASTHAGFRKMLESVGFGASTDFRITTLVVALSRRT